ncbi:uncharacterized protein M6B38_328520 [Iris pallida]|uniref:Uncharacterized protein n=1 Tax=Iris pallida TaxID=29817 RepID=A0AAX6H6R5_IRIPA|nr:uncharacterized protein M6B38_328520 [Iris pallida]
MPEDLFGHLTGALRVLKCMIRVFSVSILQLLLTLLVLVTTISVYHCLEEGSFKFGAF